MAESADFELRLLDAATGPAKQVANALRVVKSQTDKTQMALGRAQAAAQKMNAAFDKAAASSAAKALEAQAKAATKADAATRKLALAQAAAQKMNAAFDKQRAAQTKGNTFFGALGQKLGYRSVADYAKGAFVGDLAASAVTSLASGVMSAFTSAASAAVGLITGGVKMAFAEGGKAENLRLSYRLLLGERGGKQALADINGFAGKTKYDDDRIAEMMRPLFNAGLRGQGARSAFAASGDLEAAGLGSAQDFIEQFAKIQLKGGVTEKLLIGMGVNIRDFKDALAKETRVVDKEAAFKAASEGKTDPQAIMNAIFRGIERRQGGQIGTGTEAASRTMSARFEKIADLPSQYLKKISESGAWNILSDRLGGLLKQLDPDGDRGRAIVAKLTDMFSRLVDWADQALNPNNLDAFVNGIMSALESVRIIASTIVDAVNVVAHPLDASYAGLKSLATDVAHPFSDEQQLAGARDPRGMGNAAEFFDRAAPAVATRPSRSMSVTFAGDIHVNAPSDADPIEAGRMVAEEVTKRLQHAATQGGG